jgi:nitrile hydratase
VSDVHDLGGRPGFGRIEREAREPVFHARWEGRVLGMVYSAIGFGWISVDAFRHGIERMAPTQYLRAGYYERWLASLERVLAEAGVLGRSGRVARPAGAAPPRPGFERDAGAPRFAVGDFVRARVRPGAEVSALQSASRHTRLPGYVSAKRGVVVAARGGFVFPDTNAHGAGEQPQHLYCVRFDARELWGEAAEPRASVCIDLFEPYLEAAGSTAPEPKRDVA